MPLISPVLEAVPLGHLSPLSYVRQARGLSQRELERAAGLAAKSLWYLESGKRKPDPATAYRIAMALDVELRLLFPDL